MFLLDIFRPTVAEVVDTCPCQGRSDGVYMGIYTPKKSVQVDFLWGKMTSERLLNTSIKFYSTPKKLYTPPKKKNFWLRPWSMPMAVLLQHNFRAVKPGQLYLKQHRYRSSLSGVDLQRTQLMRKICGVGGGDCEYLLMAAVKQCWAIITEALYLIVPQGDKNTMTQSVSCLLLLLLMLLRHPYVDSARQLVMHEHVSLLVVVRPTQSHSTLTVSVQSRMALKVKR